MAVLNSTLMPACSCSRQFPCTWTLSHGSFLLGLVVPILQVVIPQGLKPWPDQVPGDHRPLLSAGGATPGLGQAQEYKQSPVANQLSCSPSPWPAGRPSLAGACHPALAGIPLASSLSSVHSAFGLWLPQRPSLSELSSGFIFGRSCIPSPYLLPSFREGTGPLGSAGDQAVTPATGVWISLGPQGRGLPKPPDPCDASQPDVSALLPPLSV